MGVDLDVGVGVDEDVGMGVDVGLGLVEGVRFNGCVGEEAVMPVDVVEGGAGAGTGSDVWFGAKVGTPSGQRLMSACLMCTRKRGISAAVILRDQTWMPERDRRARTRAAWRATNISVSFEEFCEGFAQFGLFLLESLLFELNARQDAP